MKNPLYIIQNSISFFFLLLLSSLSYAQQQGTSFILNQAVPPTETKDWIASDFINMINNYPSNDGFHAKPNPDPDIFVRARIDPFYIELPGGGETGGPDIVGMDNDGIVGATEGNFAVSPSGAAMYSIPIFVSPGTSGMSPELALVYNSQIGDGYLGEGWGIAGLSTITRASSNFYYDGENKPLKLTTGLDVALAIDGIRILKVKDLGVGNLEYRKEVDDFTKIIAHTVSDPDGDYFDKFTAYTKSGLIYEYGYTINSKQLLGSSSEHEKTPLKWSVSKIYDRLGNYIKFNYNQSVYNGELQISSIEYTGNEEQSLTPYCKVEFSYDLSRGNEYIEQYVDKNRYSLYSNYLTDVKSYYGGEVIRHYELSYTDGGMLPGRMFLTKVKERVNQELCYNGTVFEWDLIESEINTQAINTPIYSEGNDEIITIEIGDFNKNGRSDFVALSHNTVTDNYYLDLYHDHPSSSSIGFVERFDLPNDVDNITVGDFDGNGCSDVIVLADNAYSLYTFVAVPDPNGNYFQLRNKSILTDVTLKEGEHLIRTGDFDGNGKTDVMLIRVDDHTPIVGDEYNQFDLYYYNFDNLLQSHKATTDVWFYKHVPILYRVIYADFIVGNFTGNRSSELLINYKTKSSPMNHLLRCDVVFNQNNDYEIVKNTLSLEIFDNPNPNNPFEFVPGDFNADGKTDFLLKDGSWAILYHSYGDDFQLTKYWWDLGAMYDHIKAADFNGDGRTDLACHWDVTASAHLYITNTPGKSFSRIQFDSPSFNNLFVTENNGNGRSDFIALSGPRENRICESINILGPGKNQIIGITNGLGSKIEIAYFPYSQFSTTYIASSKERSTISDNDYPLVTYIGPLMVVAETINRSFEKNEFRKTYKYSYPVVHRLGKGFLGFAITTVTDLSDNLHPITYKTQIGFKNIEGKYYYPFQIRSQTYLTMLTNKISDAWCGDEDFVIKPNQDNALVFFPYAKKSFIASTDPITHREYKDETNLFEYDDYGNLTKLSTYIDDTDPLPSDLQDWKYKQIMTNQYDNYIDNTIGSIDWSLGRLVNSKVSHFAPDEPVESSESAFTYYPKSSPFYGMMQTEMIKSTDISKNLTKTYYYDSWGNVNLTETSTQGEATRSLINNFDDRGRFSTEIRNSLDHVESYSYVESLGLIKEHTGINGFITTFEYNGFGQLEKTIFPDKTQHINVLRWVDGVIPGNDGEIFYSWSRSSSTGVSKTIFDDRGRKLKDITDGFDGEDIIVNYYYNSKSQLRKITAPRYSNDAIISTTYDYDEIGRLKVETKPGDPLTGDRITQYEYDGPDVKTTDPNGHSHELKHYANGWVKESIDAKNNTVSYMYKSNGLQRKIIAPENLVIEMLYDDVGNRTKLIDPNLGTINYTYNGFGELKTKTDSKGQLSSFSYDILGRMEFRTENEGITNWKYDNTDYGLGKISTISGPGINETYTYDELGRISSFSESINGKMFVTSNTYDCYGRMKSLEYPSGYAIRNVYNEFGFLTKVKSANDDKTLWKADEMNAHGQYKRLSFGNGGSTYYDFYEETGLLKTIQSYGLDQINPETQEMNFTWDKVGNLTSRDNDMGYNNFITETFLYDELNRLTTATNENYNSFVDIHYNNLGSINYKSDIGTYQYEGVQPQAVSSINGTNTISKLLQTISYTSFNKINDIEEDTYKLHFTYGINHERKLTSLYKDLQLSSYKYFASGGMYEEEHINGITRKIHYISGGGGIFATYEITEDENGSNSKYNYLLKDHIGSTVGIVDDNGLLVEKYSYDAWGKRRNPQTWMPFEEQPTFNFKRGFTGHEHLDEFALINMNGRVYDPAIGAFLSPDPFISNPYYSQSLNRYAYVGNNPLSAIDPSGYWSINNFTKNDMVGWLRTGSEIAMYAAAGASGGVGAVVFVAFGMNTLNAMEAGADYSSALGAGIQGAAFSYLTANFSTAVGFINLPGGEAGQALLGAIAHGIVQGSMSAMQGGRFESGFFAGAVGSIVGSTTHDMEHEMQLTVAAVLGGTASVLGGGKFANGAVSAAFVVMFNHWHETQNQNTGQSSNNTPTETDGGYMDSASDAASFCRDRANNTTKEVSYITEVDPVTGEKKYWVQPWKDNTAERGNEYSKPGGDGYYYHNGNRVIRQDHWSPKDPNPNNYKTGGQWGWDWKFSVKIHGPVTHHDGRGIYSTTYTEMNGIGILNKLK